VDEFHKELNSAVGFVQQPQIQAPPTDKAPLATWIEPEVSTDLDTSLPGHNKSSSHLLRRACSTEGLSTCVETWPLLTALWSVPADVAAQLATEQGLRQVSEGRHLADGWVCILRLCRAPGLHGQCRSGEGRSCHAAREPSEPSPMSCHGCVEAWAGPAVDAGRHEDLSKGSV
jgi:hypothetical protein